MGQSEGREEVLTAPEAAPRVRRRRRSSRHRPSSRAPASRSRRGLRAGYFALAAVWGCLAGTGVLVVGLSSLGKPLQIDPNLAGFLGLAMILAVVGGLVASAAYRAASQRYR